MTAALKAARFGNRLTAEMNGARRQPAVIARWPMGLYILLWGVTMVLPAHAANPGSLQLPVCFTDNMVLQRNTSVAIWGRAKSGSKITITFADQTVKAKTDQHGRWRAQLKSMAASARPRTLRVSSLKSQMSFSNVLVGEVWLAGGQSNMGFPLKSHKDWKKYLPTKPNPSIRILQIPVTEFGKINPKRARWKIYDRTSTPYFSAVGFFFITELYRRLQIPVGIIGSYRGATWNENWMTPESIKNEPKLKYIFDRYEKEYGKFKNESAYEKAYQGYLVKLKEWRAKGGWSHGMVPFAPLGPKAYQRPSGLYNCMIKPLQPYPIKGVIWYQGEGNSARHEEFRTLFPAFVKGWRKTWENPDLPFYFVQLPPFKAKAWPYFRQAQLDCARAIPHCGMIVAEGCGDEKDIHPKYKKPIGDRLAIAVSAEVYGRKHVPYGPIFKSVSFQGKTATVCFDFVGKGLLIKSNSAKSFEIAGADKAYKVARYKIDAGRLILWHDSIAAPKYVRYAFSPNPDMCLFNKEGLPASPFTATLADSTGAKARMAKPDQETVK